MIACLISLVPSPALASETAAEGHAAAGRAAATDFPGLAGLCDLDMKIRMVDRLLRRSSKPKKAQTKQSANKRRAAPIPPTQVFEDLYFLGTSRVSAWLYGTEDGYILIDALTSDEEAEEKILGGMRQLGLDPTKIRYLLVTHGHGDHFGGADFLAEKLSLRIAMSDEDWTLTERMPPHPRFGPAPKRDLTVSDGELLEAGGRALKINLTPGHTLGTISPTFTVHDNGAPHRVALWGGTGFNFGENPERFRIYAASATDFGRRVKNQKVDVFLSNHARRDNSDEKLTRLRARAEGAPHPFVMGDKVQAAFTVLSQCALAQAQRFSKPD